MGQALILSGSLRRRVGCRLAKQQKVQVNGVDYLGRYGGCWYYIDAGHWVYHRRYHRLLLYGGGGLIVPGVVSLCGGHGFVSRKQLVGSMVLGTMSGWSLEVQMSVSVSSHVFSSLVPPSHDQISSGMAFTGSRGDEKLRNVLLRSLIDLRIYCQEQRIEIVALDRGLYRTEYSCGTKGGLLMRHLQIRLARLCLDASVTAASSSAPTIYCNDFGKDIEKVTFAFLLTTESNVVFHRRH